MQIRTTLMSLALGLAGLTASAQEAPSKPLIWFSAQARVEIDRDGNVVDVRPDADPSLSPAFIESIRTTVGHWRFKPPAKDGRAVGGVTFVQLNACAAPDNGNYRLALTYRSNGPARRDTAPPTYPRKAMARGDSAEMKASYRVLVDGTAKVDGIVFVEGVQSRSEQAFREALQDWIQQGKFEPEQVDGVAVETRLVFPVRFIAPMKSENRTFRSMQEAREYYAAQDAQRRQKFAADTRTCQTAMNATALQEDRQVVLDSPFQWIPSG